MPEEDGRKIDLLVVGANSVPNSLPLKDTLDYVDANGLIAIAEHPYLEAHRGMGERLLETHIGRFAAIEGFNSQVILPEWMTKVPLVGSKLSAGSKEANTRAIMASWKFKKPYVATSDAHRFEDAGLSHIQYEEDLDTTSEEAFLRQLGNRVRSGAFKTVENYAGVRDWFVWTRIFRRGMKSGRVVDQYIPSNEF